MSLLKVPEVRNVSFARPSLIQLCHEMQTAVSQGQCLALRKGVVYETGPSKFFTNGTSMTSCVVVYQRFGKSRLARP